MKTEQQTGTNPPQPDPWERIAEPIRPVDISRRNFAKSGLAVSGVLLTLSSRSALGGNLVCHSPSGFLSGNASAHGTPSSCSGLSPGYWGTHPESWPGPYQAGKCGSSYSNRSSQDSSSKSSSSDSSSKSSSSDSSSDSNSAASSLKLNTCTKATDWSEGTNFRDVFNCYGNGSIYAQYSMMQVIWLNGNQDPYQLGAHLVAAMLNLKSGYTPVLTENVLFSIYNEWNRKGYFEPTAGVQWYAPDIVSYLQSTFS
ncbi:MAG: hypothetical protein PHF75_05085 [Gallionella sp.]|nr:hypothetical protein [Gallionella sp.]